SIPEAHRGSGRRTGPSGSGGRKSGNRRRAPRLAAVAQCSRAARLDSRFSCNVDSGGDGGVRSVTFDDLSQWTNQLGAGEKLSAAAKQRIEAELPGFIREMSPKSAPARLRLPTGESLGDATRMTALKCQCLLLARSVFGANYLKADDEYDRLAK